MDLIVAACLASMGTQAEADRAVEMALLSRPSAQIKVCAECSRLQQTAAECSRLQQTAAECSRLQQTAAVELDDPWSGLAGARILPIRPLENLPRINFFRTKFTNAIRITWAPVRALGLGIFPRMGARLSGVIRG